MPVTPFHGGIGLACKGPLGRRFSFTIFTATQIVIDLESAYYLFTEQWPVHRFLHTFIGASIACFAVAILGRPFCSAFLLWCGRSLGDNRPPWLDLSPEISRGVALSSASVGMLGHVLPDSIMHADARPFAPFSSANPFWEFVSLTELHLGLIALGATGFLWLVLKAPSAH